MRHSLDKLLLFVIAALALFSARPAAAQRNVEAARPSFYQFVGGLPGACQAQDFYFKRDVVPGILYQCGTDQTLHPVASQTTTQAGAPSNPCATVGFDIDTTNFNAYFCPIPGGNWQGPISLGGSAGVASFNARSGSVTLSSTDVTTALGYSPLSPGNNLGDINSAVAARSNLGLGGAAVQANSFFLQSANNLSDLANAATARTNLGLGGAATQATSFFLQSANNLSDLANTATARSNLGLTGIFPQKFFGTAAPGSVAGNLPGDIFSDTTNHQEYWCNATAATAAPACVSVTVGGWTLMNSGGSGAVSSVFGRTGVVVAASNDYSIGQITNGVGNNQINTYSTGLQNFSAVPIQLSNNASDPGSCLVGEFEVNTTSSTAKACLVPGTWTPLATGSALSFAQNGSSFGSASSVNIIGTSGVTLTGSVIGGVATYALSADPSVVSYLTNAIAGGGGSPTVIKAVQGSPTTNLTSTTITGAVFSGYNDGQEFSIIITNANNAGGGDNITIAGIGPVSLAYIPTSGSAPVPTIANQLQMALPYTGKYSLHCNGLGGGSPCILMSGLGPASITSTGTGATVFANTPTLITPILGAATATSLLATGIIDGLAPVTITTGSSATLGGTYHTGYTLNQEATAATAVTYTLPTAAGGLQYCVANSFNGSAADTGALELLTSATGQFIIYTDGTLSATGGFVVSGGAARDSACVVGVDATHWMLYVSSGVWTKH